jgi:hypothetical protein
MSITQALAVTIRDVPVAGAASEGERETPDGAYRTLFTPLPSGRCPREGGPREN